MQPAELHTLAARFPYLQLRFFLRLHQGGRLPAFKGSLWHGWLGHMVKGNSPLYHLLYGEHEGQQPKPYVIRTDGNRQEQWQAGELITFDVILLGAATQAAEHLIAHLSKTACCGLGFERLGVSIHSVATVTPQGLQPGLHHGVLADWLSAKPLTLWHEVALQLESPLRMKYQGQIVKQGPLPLSFLLEQIARRWSLLTHFWVDDHPHWRTLLQQALPNLGDHQTQGTCLRVEDWQRYSVRQKEHLPFGGLTGQLCYQGDIAPALFWLQIGERLHIGGKTTFGLGQYQLIA